MKRLAQTFLLYLALAASGLAWAGDGHDHGDSPTAAGGAALPRVEAVSDQFELVGVVDRDVLILYLDRAATNEPVTRAVIDVEFTLAKGSHTTKGEPQADGTYLLRSGMLARPGQYALTFSVTVGDETDVLAGNLEIADPEAGHDHRGERRWSWLALGMALMALVATVLLARRWSRRGAMTSAAFAFGLWAAMAVPPPAVGGEGHDHGDAPAAASGNSPRRLPDGDVFLPKPSQRQLAVRTALAKEAELPRTVTLMGRVVMDPNAGGKVQPTVSGRIEPGPRGLPNLGQRVNRGEVLALVRSAAGSIERANQNASIAELQVARDLAERRLARLKQLEGSVSQREIEQAQADSEGTRRRLAAVTAREASLEALVAPVSGVIAAANVVAGQVVDAREVLFEIVDPRRQRIEAVAFDSALAAGISGASAAPQSPQAHGVSIPLKLVGAGRSQVEGGYPVQFVATGNDVPPLTVGQPMRVFAQTTARVKGMPVPAGAVVKNPSNEDIVWVKEGPERFSPRPVRFEPVDGANVVVVTGLKSGERVVVQAAPLVNQVR